MFGIALAASSLVLAQTQTAIPDRASDAFMSGLYVCRQIQMAPQNAEDAAAVLWSESWKPALTPLGAYLRDGVRVFLSDDKKSCHVQTAARIDLERLKNWMEVTGALDGRVKRFEWNQQRTRPVIGDTYRLWHWDSWRAAGGSDPGVLTYKVMVLPGATQPRPGEQAVTATVSYRLKRAE